MKPTCIGAILAGGASTRMGRDKAALRLADGRAMIEVVALALWANCDRIVVSGAGSALNGVEHIIDARNGRGPLAGIEAVLASGRGDMYLLCPCDMPRLTSVMLAPLARAPHDATAVVLHPRGADRYLPLPARLSSAALPLVAEALDAGEGAVHRLLDRLDPLVIECPGDWAAALRGANTPEELGE